MINLAKILATYEILYCCILKITKQLFELFAVCVQLYRYKHNNNLMTGLPDMSGFNIWLLLLLQSTDDTYELLMGAKIT